MYSPISIRYTLSNTVLVNGSSTQVKPVSPFIPLTWDGATESIYVAVDNVLSTDWTYDASNNNITFTGTFHKDDLPVILTVERITAGNLPAEFYPGSAIRAEDLNENYKHLLERVQQLETK